MKKTYLIIIGTLLWGIPGLLLILTSNLWIIALGVILMVAIDSWIVTRLFWGPKDSNNEKTITLKALETYLRTSLHRKPSNVLEELLAFIVHTQRPNRNATEPSFSLSVSMLKDGIRPKPS